MKKLSYPSRRERMRLSRNEKKVSNAIALPISLLVLIVFYFVRLNMKLLFRSKRWLGRISIVCFMLYNAYTTFSLIAIAPKPAHALDGQPKQAWVIPTLNPDLTEREQNIALIQKIWGKDAYIGLSIAKCESGYRTTATHYNDNGTVDQGVFQMNSVHNMPEMDTAVANISTAYLLYKDQGTAPWSSSEGCWAQ